jgi:acyl-CoA dehydrogenase
LVPAAVNFERDEIEEMIRTSVREIAADYGEEYWREVRESGRFPQEIWTDLADHGLVGVALPEAYGGEGMGLQEMGVIIEELARSQAWEVAGQFVLSPVFGGETLKQFGTEAQKERWLPATAAGEMVWALGVTEPDAGLNTTDIDTRAEKEGDEYVVSGRKIFTSGVNWADRIVLLTRTTPVEEVDRPSQGLSILMVDADDPNLAYDEIEMDIFWAEPTFNTYFDDVRVHESDLVGEEGKGLQQLFYTLNAERVTTAYHSLGLGYRSVDRAAEYAKDREPFADPIGSYQGIQHPLADAYAELRTAELMLRKAAWEYDEGSAAGTASNIGNLQAGKAAWSAVEAAMTTFGGMSASKDIGIAKMWDVVRHLRTAPVSEEMLRNYIAEHELGLPRSYRG